MLGKLNKTETQLQVKFLKMIQMYAQLVYFNMMQEDFIEPLRDVFTDIATELEVDFQQMYDNEVRNLTASQTVEQTSSIYDPLTLERYTEIVKHSIAFDLSKEYSDKAQKASDAIVSIENSVPDGMTKKAWNEQNKGNIEKLREERDTAKKMVTETRNNVDTDVVIAKAKDMFEKTNGIVTNEQITMRLNYLLENVFYEEKTNEQFYPTPDDIVQRYIVDALKKENIPNNALILEPSAGRANIADAVKNAYPSSRIEVCEINPLRREVLELKNYTIVGDDFMKYGVTRDEEKGKNIVNDSVKNRYDAIVMNPPYNSGVDIRHVKRAYELLKPNGVLIAIISEGSAFSEQRKDAVGFDMWLKDNGVISKQFIDNATYSKMLDRPIAIGIGVITLRKPFPKIKTESGKEYKIPEIITADTSYQLDIDPNFVRANVIVTNKHLIQPPKFEAKEIMKKYGNQKWINDYVFFGVRKAIDSLDKNGGFLLADGTGTGKTIQCLMVAEHYYKKTGKPVLMFTVDDRVLQSGVFGDAEKLGMLVPDKIDMSEEDDINKRKKPTRPDNYKGLYGLNDKLDKEAKSDYDKPVTCYAFNIKSPKLRDGINVTTYHNLSQWKGAEKEESELKSAEIRKKEVDKEFKEKKEKGLAALDKEFPKNPRTKKREPNGYKDALEKFKEEIKKEQKNHPIYAEVIEKTVALSNARIEAMKKWCGNASIIILDEAHQVKNTGSGANDATAQRAELARAITDTADRVMFVTATPCDRPGDLLYLKRAGLFKTDEQFKNLMAEIGVYWDEPIYNDRREVIQLGRWDFSGADVEYMAGRFASIFDTLYEDGNMLRRELEFRNLNVNMDKITMGDDVIDLMKQIEEDLTSEDENGREVKNMGNIIGRQLEELEEHKLDKVIEITNDAIAKGHNVLIFVQSVDTGKDERSWTGKPKPGAVRILKEKLSKMYGEDKVGVIVGTTGEYEKYRRLENVADFQSRKRRILIGTVKSGGTGLNLDDQVGNAPRTMILVTLPLSMLNVVQAVGRIVRAKTSSKSELHVLFAENVEVDKWLSNLLAVKFATLHATVKGEISALNIEKLREVEAGGESAVAASADVDSNKTTKHSLYKKENTRVNGWELPSGIPLYVEKSGTPMNRLLCIGAKPEYQRYFDTWIENNQEFIKMYGLKRNPSSMHQKFNGRHYGLQSVDSRKTEELWNALLNVVDPQLIRNNLPTVQIFKVGDKVEFMRSVGMFNIGFGTKGEVVNVRSILLGKNAQKQDIIEYRYDIEVRVKGNKEIVKRVPVGWLDFAEKKPQIKIKHEAFFREAKGWEKDGGTIYDFYVITESKEMPNNYICVELRTQYEYAKKWGRRGREDDYSKIINVRDPSKLEVIKDGRKEIDDYRTNTPKLYDVQDIIDKVKYYEWICLEDDCFYTDDNNATKKNIKIEREVEEEEVEQLSDNMMNSQVKQFKQLYVNFHMGKNKKLFQEEYVEPMESIIKDIADEVGVALPTTCPPTDENGKRLIDKKSYDELMQCIAAMPQTKALHTNANGEYTAEREALHDDIIKDFTKTLPCMTGKPIAIFTGGASGSGKSTFLKKYAPFMTSDKILKIDIDAMREYLPEYVGWNADSTQAEVKDIYNRLLDEIGTDCQYDLLIDGTMNKTKSYFPLIEKLRGFGYQIYVIYIRVTKEKSLRRVRERYVRSGRFVPDFVVDEIFENGEAPMRSIIEKVDGYMIIDNNSDTPEIIETGGEQVPKERDYGFNNESESENQSKILFKEGEIVYINVPIHTYPAYTAAQIKYNYTEKMKQNGEKVDIYIPTSGYVVGVYHVPPDVLEKKKAHKPIRQLGTGAYVYYESKTSSLRVNDSDFDDIDTLYLLVPGYKMAVPLRSIEFDISELDEVMELAVMIDRKFPEGLPSYDAIRNASNERLLQMIREADEKPKDEKPKDEKPKQASTLSEYIYTRLRKVFNNKYYEQLSGEEIQEPFQITKNKHEKDSIVRQARTTIFTIINNYEIHNHKKFVFVDMYIKLVRLNIRDELIEQAVDLIFRKLFNEAQHNDDVVHRSRLTELLFDDNLSPALLTEVENILSNVNEKIESTLQKTYFTYSYVITSLDSLGYLNEDQRNLWLAKVSRLIDINLPKGDKVYEGMSETEIYLYSNLLKKRDPQRIYDVSTLLKPFRDQVFDEKNGEYAQTAIQIIKNLENVDRLKKIGISPNHLLAVLVMNGYFYHSPHMKIYPRAFSYLEGKLKKTDDVIDEKPEDDSRNNLPTEIRDAFKLIDKYNNNKSEYSFENQYKVIKEKYFQHVENMLEQNGEEKLSEYNLEFAIKRINEYKGFQQHFENVTRHKVGTKNDVELIDMIRVYAGQEFALRLVVSMFMGKLKHIDDYFDTEAKLIYNKYSFIFSNNAKEILSKGKQYAENRLDGLSDTLITEKGFHSRLDKAVQQLPDKVKKQSLLNLLKKSKQGVSSTEIDMSKLNTLLQTDGETITKSEVEQFLKKNGITIREYVLGENPEYAHKDNEHILTKLHDVILHFQQDYRKFAERLESDVYNAESDGDIEEGGEVVEEWEKLSKKITKAYEVLELITEDDIKDLLMEEKSLNNLFGDHKIFDEVQDETKSFIEKYQDVISFSVETYDVDNELSVHTLMLLLDDKQDDLKENSFFFFTGNKTDSEYDDDAVYGDGSYNALNLNHYVYEEYLYQLDYKVTLYNAKHFDYLGANLLGHYRCNHNKDNYIIEEIQSDWSQDLDFRHLSAFPSMSDFIEFITKVIIVNAVKAGTKIVYFTSGEIQNKRWNKVYSQFSYLSWSKNGNVYECKLIDNNNKVTRDNVKEQQLVGYFGKKIANEMKEKPSGEIDLDPTMFYGDKGFIEMYGSTELNSIGIIGKKFNEILKPYGEHVTISDYDGYKMFTFDIPRQLQEKIQSGEHSFTLMDKRN